MQSDHQKDSCALSSKSIIELKTMIIRQESIANDGKFIAKLPDKGEKIKCLIAKLKKEIKHRDHVDLASNLLNKMSVDDPANSSADRDTNHDESLQQILNPGHKYKTVIDERGDGSKYQNSYEKIMQNSKSKPQHRAKFYANRTTNDRDVKAVTKELNQSPVTKRDVISLHGPITSCADALENALKQKEYNRIAARMEAENDRISDNNESMTCSESASVVSTHKTLQDLGDEGKICSALKYRYDESLEMASLGAPLRYKGSQLLSIDDSVQLLKEHTKKLELLQAEQAAMKLSSRLGSALVNIEGSSMNKYRNTNEIDSDSSLSDAEGYPD